MLSVRRTAGVRRGGPAGRGGEGVAGARSGGGENCGAKFPVSRITVNLAPARVRKEGTVYDLPILLGILAAAEEISPLPQGAAFWAS